MTGIAERLDAIFALDPSSIAIEQDRQGFTYADIVSVRMQLDSLLTARGLGVGVPVGLMLRNRPVSLAAALAVIWTWRCLVTVNPLLPAAPLRRDLQSLSVPVLIAEPEDWSNPVFAEAARSAGSFGISLSEEDGRMVLEPVLEPRAEESLRPPLHGVAVEMLTSGTTGAPKRIKLERHSLERSLAAGSKYESGDGSPKLQKSPALLWMPLGHIGGLWNALYQFYNGRRILLLEKFSVEQWHDAIVTHRLRFATLPPSALGDVLARHYPQADFASLSAIRCGAAPLDHALAADFETRYGIPVLEAYGATEFAGGVAGWTISDHRQFSRTKRASVGRANAGVALRVVDPESFEVLPPDHEGLLEVKTQQVGDGKTWIRTTDRARLDEDGFLFILGRADNAINRGGFKVTPEHVEAALRNHPALGEVCVVGIADARLGQVPVAAYALRPGADDPGPSSLKSYLGDHLKPYEIPVRFLAVDKLPRTPSLKISQLGVRDLFAQQGAA